MMDRPRRGRRVVRLEPARRTAVEGLRLLPPRAQGRQRPRLRRPAPQDRRALRAIRAGAAEVRPAVPLRDGGRVPGHEPPAVPAHPPPRRDPPQPLRRRRPGPVDLQVARRRPAQHPRLRAGLPRSDRRQARAELPLHAGDSRRRHRRSSARTATARTSASGPIARAGRASRTSAAATSSRRPTSSRETARSALAADRDVTVAVLYRTNAQSRTIEDALMREGLAYKIVGGVRFYERKEVKDALAYLRLVINPHDDVSLRRVINVPPRGIGKGVMDALDAIEPAASVEHLPLLAAGLQPAPVANSLWARLVLRTRRDGAFTAARVGVPDGFPRSPRRPSPPWPARRRVSIAIGKVLDQSGYLQDLRDERSEDAEGRVENLAELVSAAREYESREPEPALCGLRRPPVAPLRRRRGSRHARRPRLADDAAQRQGPGVPRRGARRPRGGPLPAFASRPTTRKSSRRSAGSATSG